MKNILLLGLILLGSLKINAQSPNYDDLKILYADANYEKLVKAAEKYTLKEETMSDPIPFIWLSKGLYKISMTNTTDEKFRNAYMDALSALANAMKKDKKANVLKDDPLSMEYITLFQNSLFDRLNAEYVGGNFIKVSTWAMKYQKITENVIGAKYLIGACKYVKKDKGGAMKDWKEADKLAENINLDSFSEADKNIFKLGILKSAESYVNLKQTDKGKTLLDKYADFFKEDEDFNTKYKELF